MSEEIKTSEIFTDEFGVKGRVYLEYGIPIKVKLLSKLPKIHFYSAYNQFCEAVDEHYSKLIKA
jgi:hypothetical protein